MSTRTASGTVTELGPKLLGGICELTLQTSELDALERFYVDCFGATVISRAEDRIWLACGDRTRLGIWTPGRKEFGDRGGRHVHFALSASPGKLNELVERLTAKAVRFRGPVEHAGGDRSIYVEDPEKNVVEVWDFFERGEGRREGAAALAGDDVSPDDPSS
ncbi:MAG TPA: VOC family protein [Gaiellaceae bacterium]|nr:VOC family protein [Gaiellaceae bacterium]